MEGHVLDGGGRKKPVRILRFMMASLAAAAPTLAAAPVRTGLTPADTAALTRLFRSIYATFAPGARGDGISKSNEASLFSPGTLDLIRTNRRLSGGGEDLPGYDVACLCQDYDAISFTGASYSPAKAPGLVNATVTVGFTISGKRGPKSYRYVMQRTPGGWRIHDITLMGGKSYRAELQDAIGRYTASAPGAPTATQPQVAKPGTKVAITTNDIALAARTFGFTAKGGKVFDDCGAELNGMKREDLNGDGLPELIFMDGICNGGESGWVGIATRAPSGAWRSILQQQGEHEVLKTRHGGWADIRLYIKQVSPPPVLRWSGTEYRFAPSVGLGGSDSRRAAAHFDLRRAIISHTFTQNMGDAG